MLPVIDRQKRVIGFGGRLLDPEAKDRKYVNSPESPLFHKKESLYGLHAALDAIRRSGTADRRRGELRRARAAPGGHRRGRRADGNRADRGAGRARSASWRARSRWCSTATPPASARRPRRSRCSSTRTSTVASRGCPPASIPTTSCARARTARRRSRRLVEGARPMLDQFIQDIASEATIAGRVAALRAIAALLVRVKNPTTRELYAGQLAGVSDLASHQVTRALREAAAKRQPPRSRRRSRRPRRRRPWSPGPKLPAEELEVLVAARPLPRAAAHGRGARAGELLIHPAVSPAAPRRRRAGRARRQARRRRPGSTRRLPASAATIAAALMDGGSRRLADPAGYAGKIGESARDFARGRRDVDEHTFAKRSAGTGG